MCRITFVLGGTRCGKSKYAELKACESGLDKIYVATAEILDSEMHERIKIHQDRRGKEWITIEETIDIAKIISDSHSSIVLVDCLTVWLSNLLHKKTDVLQQFNLLIEAIKSTRSQVILVASEVGMGIVPENALARKFRDYSGILQQKIAEIADEVVLVVAGIPLKIKG